MLNSETAAGTEVLRAALNCLPDPVLVVDHSLHIAFANNAAEQLCGFNLSGQLFVAALRHPEALDCLTKASETGSPETARIALTVNGVETKFKLTVAPLPASGREGALAVTLRDDSDTAGAELMRRSFVANVSHELRSPLTALITCAETLRRAPPGDRAAQLTILDLMEQETKRMNRLVSGLLSLSKVEANERVRPTTPVNIQDILNSAVRSLQGIAEERNTAMRLNCGANDLQVIGDSDQLSQIFLNLIENAVKYGREGGCVEVSCRFESQSPDILEDAVLVEVSDDGAGIDPVHLPRLTERFYRVDEHRSKSVGGTGLGLAIVKHIVQRHRGRLSISSVPGTGSVFCVALPAAAE